jgi:hypothetical protein
VVRSVVDGKLECNGPLEDYCIDSPLKRLEAGMDLNLAQRTNPVMQRAVEYMEPKHTCRESHPKRRLGLDPGRADHHVE